MTDSRLIFADTTPGEKPEDIVAWAEEFIRLPGSARSESFNSSITPWLIQPLRWMHDDVTRIMTFVKPVQCGGSTVGEIITAYWCAYSTGYTQYNWEDDEKAAERWKTRIMPVLESCPEIRWLSKRFSVVTCEATLPNLFLKCQGVHMPSHLDSNSVRNQINEEIHSWKPGHLAKARNRTTAVFASKTADISNASMFGDQLHEAFLDGTLQHWEVRCPGCGQYHVMRTRWNDREPHLGGLRYNADGCRREDGIYDYNRLEPTIFFQMPCGYRVHDIARERRALSMSGRYSEPRNTGAHVEHRSATLEAVSVDYIPWLKLIREKHSALRALKYGDPKPWMRYLQERECIFYKEDDRPTLGTVIVLEERKKSREGLPGRAARLFALDRQRGNLAHGETPYWWMVIRDVMPNGDSLLVWEGKLQTDEEVISTLRDHNCDMRHGCADTGWVEGDDKHVYQFCIRYGISGIKGRPEKDFAHSDGSRRIFSPERPLYEVAGMPRNANHGPKDEAKFWLYSKHGIRERLYWIRNSKESAAMSGGEYIRHDAPSDVSHDYMLHNEAEDRCIEPTGRTKENVVIWRQRAKRNDLFVCECYIAMLMEIGGFIGEFAGEQIQPEEERKSE